jgi:hypothetical protein
MLIIQMDFEGPDLDKIENRFKETMEDGLDELAEEVEWFWRQKASETLVESKDKYLKDFSIERVGGEVQVVLKGMAAAMEGGSGPQNLGQTFGLGKIIPMGFPPAVGSAHFHQGRVMPRFRTVSNNSPWMHKGITPGVSGSRPTGISISERVQTEMDERIVDEVFTKVFNRIEV